MGLFGFISAIDRQAITITAIDLDISTNSQYNYTRFAGENGNSATGAKHADNNVNATKTEPNRFSMRTAALTTHVGST